MAAFAATLFAQEYAAQAARSGRQGMPWNVAAESKKAVLRIIADQ